jgi:hypothetical protein
MDVQRFVSGGLLCGAEVFKAIARGELQPARDYSCVDCGVPASEYDHRDYNEPLSVAPVCRKCNARRGAAIPRRWADGELLLRLRRIAARQRIVPWAIDHCFWRLETMCERVERLTSMAITRHDLRPDLFTPTGRRRRRLNLPPNPYAQ